LNIYIYISLSLFSGTLPSRSYEMATVTSIPVDYTPDYIIVGYIRAYFQKSGACRKADTNSIAAVAQQAA
jgi:hypothetical protein